MLLNIFAKTKHEHGKSGLQIHLVNDLDCKPKPARKVKPAGSEFS